MRGHDVVLADGWLKEDMERATQRVKDMALHDKALAVLRALANTPWKDWRSRRELHKQFQEFK